MQQHKDSLPVQHASLRWLQLQLQLHHLASNSNSNISNGSAEGMPTGWRVVFSAGGLLQRKLQLVSVPLAVVVGLNIGRG